MPETAHDQPQPSGRWSARRQWHPAGGGAGGWRPQLDPGTGQPFTEVRDLTAAEAAARLEQIRAGYHPGRVPPATERAELLLAMAALVEDHAGDLGELDALCTGKLRAHATGTAQAGAAILRYYAGLLDAGTYSAELPADQPGARQFVDRLPVGLAACILPWNFPLSQGCARLAMLFAAGCAGVFKGSELAQPPLLALAELAATVWTTSAERVGRMRATLRTGQLYVNTHGQVPRNTPWGGFRLSGIGRLYGRDGLFAFTEARQTYELGFS